MASVVVCPHCYLQLAVPDGIESAARVRCPACRDEFELSSAEPRSLPEVVRVEPTDYMATTSHIVPIRERQQREREAQPPHPPQDEPKLSSENSTWRTISRVEPLVGEMHHALGGAGTEPVQADPSAAQDDDLEQVSSRHESLPANRAAGEQPPSKSSAVTLADLQSAAADSGGDQVDPLATVANEPAEPLRRESRVPQKQVIGPTFDLPNVPLSKPPTATVDLGPAPPAEPAANTDFKLDDVAIDSAQSGLSAGKTVAGNMDQTVAFHAGPPSLSSAQTVPDAEDWQQLIRDSSAEPLATEPAEHAAVGGQAAPANNPWGELPDPDDAAADHAVAARIIPTAGRRRKRSVVRTLVGCALFGIGGLAIGYYFLLWYLGPRGDFLGIANRLPAALLPSKVRPVPAEVALATDPMPPPSDAVVATPRPNTETDREPADNSSNLPAGYEQPIELPAEPLDEQPPGQLEVAADTPPSAAESRYGANRPDREKPPTKSYGAEPARFEEPAAEVLASGGPRVTGGPSYTADQLATALEAANDAQPGLVTGDLSDKAVRQIKGRSYATLCELAEVLTFCDESSTARFGQLQRDAEDLFRRTLSDAHTRGEVARIAAIWIKSPNRQHGGVFVAGRTSGGEIVGEVYEYQLQAEDGDVLAILSAHPLEGRADAGSTQFGIVGTIVDGPAATIAGYTGNTPQAIWVGRAIPLD